MGWFGKIAGATIGFIIGGPLGAAGGAFLGHKFLDNDNNLTEHESVQANYFVALFSMLGKIAKADGIVTKEEIDAVDNVIKYKLRLNGEQRRFAIEVFNKSKDSEYTFENFAQNFYQINRNNRNILNFMLVTLFEVASADGVFHKNEEELLKRAKVIFGISDFEYDSIKKQYFPLADIEKHYAILESKPEDSDSTIKKNYRRLVQEYHPDRLQNKGMSEEFAAYAKEKFQKIQDAYDYIRQQRNF